MRLRAQELISDFKEQKIPRSKKSTGNQGVTVLCFWSSMSTKVLPACSEERWSVVLKSLSTLNWIHQRVPTTNREAKQSYQIRILHQSYPGKTCSHNSPACCPYWDSSEPGSDIPIPPGWGTRPCPRSSPLPEITGDSPHSVPPKLRDSPIAHT